MIVRQKNAAVHSPSYCILLPQRTFRDKKGDDVIYFSQRYWLLEFNFTPLLVFARH